MTAMVYVAPYFFVIKLPHIMKHLLLVAAMAVSMSCAQKRNTKKTTDTRPKDQVLFMHKVDRIKQDLLLEINDAKLDQEAEILTKYASDSLSNIKNWVVVVNSIEADAWQPLYRLETYSIIKQRDTIDPTLDSLNIPQAEVVFINYNVPKVTSDALKRGHLKLLKEVNPGDTLLISGLITKMGKGSKPYFSELVRETGNWDMDLIATNIVKK